MSGEARIVVRLVVEPGPHGFWPRENYFEGGAQNGYALVLRPPRRLALAPGAALRLEVPHHVPHLPYAWDGPAITLAAGRDATLLFTWGGRVRLLDAERIEKFVQHALDPAGTTETPGARGLAVRQQGARGGPLLYTGEVVPLAHDGA